MIAFFIPYTTLTTLNKNTPHLTNLPHNQQNNDTNNLCKQPILLIDLFNNSI